MDNKVRYWIDLAEYDFETAKAMFDTKRYLYVGFMLHQTIEKVLKGYYVKNIDENPPYTHSLLKMAQKVSVYDEFSDEQKDLLDILDPLNIQARYPSHKEKILSDLDSHRCSKLISEAGELFTWIKQRL